MRTTRSRRAAYPSLCTRRTTSRSFFLLLVVTEAHKHLVVEDYIIEDLDLRLCRGVR